MFRMPKAFPLEFRRDVVAVASRGEAPIARIAKDFGILRIVSATLVEAGRYRGRKSARVTQADPAELREAKKRIRLLEQEIQKPACQPIADQPIAITDVPVGPRTGRRRVPVTVTRRGTRLLQTSVLRLAVGSGLATGLG